MTRVIQFRSKKDGRAFKVKVPESAKDIEDDDFIEVDGKIRMAEEIQFDDRHWERLSESVPREGELVYSVEEVYDLYYYEGEFYWDKASGCVLSRLQELR